jgi:fagellar hook-basal body proteins
MGANNIAISGLNAINDQLNSISNNIANSGTVGFKSGRAEFASMYAEGQPLGVGVTGVTESINKGGSIFSSGNSLDLAINGSGFFVMRDSSGSTAYTRAGYMQTDSSGYLVNNQGMRLQGYPVDANGDLQVGSVGDLQMTSGSIPAKATTTLDFSANLDANADVPPTATFDPADNTSYNNTYATQVYDSLGREHTLNQYYVKTGDNTWDTYYYMDGAAIASPSPQALNFDNQGLLTTPSGPVNLNVPVTGAAAMDIAVNYNGTTQFGSDFSVSKTTATATPPASAPGR